MASFEAVRSALCFHWLTKVIDKRLLYLCEHSAFPVIW